MKNAVKFCWQLASPISPGGGSINQKICHMSYSQKFHFHHARLLGPTICWGAPKVAMSLLANQKSSRKACRGVGNVWGSVNPRFGAGFPFSVLKLLRIKALRDSGRVFLEFPEILLRNTREDPAFMETSAAFSILMCQWQAKNGKMITITELASRHRLSWKAHQRSGMNDLGALRDVHQQSSCGITCAILEGPHAMHISLPILDPQPPPLNKYRILLVCQST